MQQKPLKIHHSKVIYEKTIFGFPDITFTFAEN